ncbi:MAG: DUF4293 domain-containing protein [Bacteroidales bacterium]
MIQRIQTLFLLIGTALISLMLFLPLAIISTYNTQYLLKADALINVMKDNQAELISFPLLIMLAVMVLVPLIAIFLYKKRMLQIRVTIFSSILNALFYALFFYEYSSIMKSLPVGEYMPTSFGWVLVCPAIAIIFNILAIRKIGQDEMLIRSLNSNRIR